VKRPPQFHPDRTLCVAVLLLGIATVLTASAEDPAAPSGNPSAGSETDRIIVTGSKIPTSQTAAEVGPNPLELIDRYTIDKSGERNTERLLRDLPVANANGLSPSGTGGSLTTEGGASISLRGLDTGATLVLVDGHRISSHPSGAAFGIETFFDLNTIPRAAIESIEILKDGASTTYGADAIAGVVNIKLRHDFRAAEVNLEYGNTTNRDSGERTASLLFGEGNDKTSFTGVLNYYSRNSIIRSDRAYDREAGARLSSNSNPFNLEVSRTAAEAAAGRPISEVDPSLDSFFTRAPFFSNGNTPASSYVFSADPSATFNFNPYVTEMPDTERYGGYLNASHKLFGQQLVLYGDVFFQRSEADFRAAPAPTFNFATPGEAPVTPLAIPPHAPGATLGGPSYADVGLAPGAYNPFNPFQQIISEDSRGRLMEFGNRKFDHRTDSFFTTLGLRGDKLFDGSWGYNAGFRYSRIEARHDITTISSSRFQRTLNAADPIFDPNSPEFIGTTVPYNPFGDYRVPIANNYRFTDFVTIHPHEIDVGSLTSFDLNVYTTDLFKLPAGGVGVAFGMQLVHETQKQSPDEILQTGDELGVGGVFGGGDFGRESYAGYAETTIPIFGPTYNVTGIRALDFTAAVRFEAFSNDTNVMVPKFGMRWQPFDDSVTVRATWGEGFREPTLAELNAPTLNGVLDLFDPIKGEFRTEVPTRFLGNPNLQPEDSRQFTAGIVYSPKFVPGLTLTVDLFNIETTGWIDPNPDPSRIIQRIEAGQGLPGESTTRDAGGNLTQLTYVSFANSGSQKVRGADFGLTYELPTRIGTFRSTTQATYLDSYQFAALPGDTEIERRGSPVDDFSDDAYLKWKGLSRLDWIWNQFDAAITAHYLDGFHEHGLNGFPGHFVDHIHYVSQTWLFDLQASYEFETHSSPNWSERLHHGWPTWRYLLDHTKLTVGVNNVFDHDPPHSVDNFPRFIYDTSGRFIYARLTKTF
jgi:iron complex outermembrane receptor protein